MRCNHSGISDLHGEPNCHCTEAILYSCHSNLSAFKRVGYHRFNMLFHFAGHLFIPTKHSSCLSHLEVLLMRKRIL